MKQAIYLFLLLALWSACSKDGSISTSNGSDVTGQGGSLAKFTIVGNYLYTVDGTSLGVFDISNGQAPVFINKTEIGRGIEAIFPYKNKLFIASSTGMYLYTLDNPTHPVEESYVQHLTGCDPVVVNDSIAFLTIHGGNRCRSTINQLQVYDIRNIRYPVFISALDLTNPYGLGLKDTVLYVCDNGVGLRSFSVKNPYQIKALSIETSENFFDVIPMDTSMVCMLSNGVAFYNIKNPGQIQKLSTIRN